jgi:hypothetical protein
MKSTPWFSHSNYLSRVRMGLAGALVIAAVGMALVAAKTSTPSRAPTAHAFVLKKGDPDKFGPGGNKRTVFGGANEYRAADYTPGVEAYLVRAYPDNEISGDSTIAAKNGWSKLNSSSHSPGSWTLIGPSTASFPAVLTFSGAPYITSGRITALAIAPNCRADRDDRETNGCRLWVGAAGGGIWRTDNALATTPTWTFLSNSFGTNAIGSILVDPNNSDIIYAGTGEPNASGDSEAGVGIYKSTDGGNTWALVPDSGKFFQRAIGQMDFDKDHKLLVPIASAVRGVSSVSSGASSSRATGHPLPTRGLYRCDGTTCTLLRGTFIRGSTTVKADPTNPGVIYVNAFSEGIWRSGDNGATWTQIKAPLDPASSADRAEFDVTTLLNGKTRMYVGDGSDAFPAPRARFYRTDDAVTATNASFTDLTTDRNIGYCDNGVNGSQCWYDNFVVTPAGNPDMVYLGGAYSYNSYGRSTNGRGVLRSIDAGAHWGDQTWDATTPPTPPDNCCNPSQFAPNGMHPDQHALVVSPSNPGLFFEGSDGGLMRSSGSFADISSQCDSRGLTPTSLARCKELLSRVPSVLSSMNKGLSTLQFQSLSVAAPGSKNTFSGNGDDNGAPQTKIQGGTQDNGTFQFTGSTNLWPQEIYGDGGQSGFSSTSDRLRFNTFTGQANDANFRDGDPLKWVIISAPIISSNEASYFYPPVISDPHPANAQTIFQGSFSVWRTQDWGGNQAYLEANCQEFTESASKPGCGDFVPLGGPASGSGSDPGDLTGTFYGPTRKFGAVAWLQRAPQNTGTMWAATGAGRVFISDNVDAAAAASVVWTRLDAGASPPNRAISAIAVDPMNANHAWISYNGYNLGSVPTTAPGHVFEAMRTGPTATFTDISYNLPDFPITALVRDDRTGDLYAGSDFGVMRLPNGSTTWVVAGTGLPMVEVSGLTIVPEERKLYAATHGRSGWMLQLPEGD